MAEDVPLQAHPRVSRVELDNGLKVVMMPNDYPRDRFYAYLNVDVGSLYEEDHEQGLAHYLEHVVFLGTEKWQTAEEMKEVMGALGMSFGGDTNASTDQRNTIYTMEAPSGAKQEQTVVELLFEMMFKARLQQGNIDSERGPILNEKQARNTIAYRRSVKLMELMHSNNLLPKRLPIGLEEQIKGFGASDLRHFYTKWYYPGNMTLYVVGVFDQDRVLEQVRGTFGAMPPRPASEVPLKPEVPISYGGPPGPKKVDLFLHDLQTHFTASVDCYSPLRGYTAEGDFARETIDQLIGLCFEDRIEALRSSQADPPFVSICLDAESDATYRCKTLSLSVASRALDWRRAMRVAVREVCKLGKFGVSADELQLAKQMVLKEQEDEAQLNETTPSSEWIDSLMDYDILSQVLSDKVRDLEVLRRILPEITLEQVCERCREMTLPITTFGDEENPCGVLLCGPIDPAAMLHHGGQDEEEDEDAEEAAMQEDADAEEEEEMASPTKRSLHKRHHKGPSLSPTKTPLSPGKGVPTIGATLGSPVKDPAEGSEGGSGDPTETARDWPVTETSWRECVAGAISVSIENNAIHVPSCVVSREELEARRRSMKPHLVVVQLRDGGGSGARVPDALAGTGAWRQGVGLEPVQKKLKVKAFAEEAEGRAGLVMVDEEVDVRMMRLSSGVKVNVKHTTFEAGQVSVRVTARGGKMLEGRCGCGRVGELSLALDTLMDSGMGEHSAQDIERYLTLHAIGVESAVNMESVTLTLSVSNEKNGLERLLEFLHNMIQNPRFDEDAWQRAVKDRKIEEEQRNKSLSSLTWAALMRAATGDDKRFLHGDSAHIASLSLESARDSLLATLRPERLEVAIVGDFKESFEALAELLLLYLGTLSGAIATSHPAVAAQHTALVDPLHSSKRLPLQDEPPLPHRSPALALPPSPAASAGGAARKTPQWKPQISTLTLADEEPRAVINMCFRTVGMYGQDGDGRDASWDVKDKRRLHLARSFTVLSRVLNNRMHDHLREKLGLGYVASFGSVQYSLLDGGFAYLNLTALPERVPDAIRESLQCLAQLTLNDFAEAELIKARDPIVASKRAVLAQNSTWLSYLGDLQLGPVPKLLDDIKGAHDHYKTISLQDLEVASRLCIRPGTIWTSVGVTSSASIASALADASLLAVSVAEDGGKKGDSSRGAEG